MHSTSSETRISVERPHESPDIIPRASRGRPMQPLACPNTPGGVPSIFLEVVAPQRSSFRALNGALSSGVSVFLEEDKREPRILIRAEARRKAGKGGNRAGSRPPGDCKLSSTFRSGCSSANFRRRCLRVPTGRARRHPSSGPRRWRSFPCRPCTRRRR